MENTENNLYPDADKYQRGYTVSDGIAIVWCIIFGAGVAYCIARLAGWL